MLLKGRHWDLLVFTFLSLHHIVRGKLAITGTGSGTGDPKLYWRSQPSTCLVKCWTITCYWIHCIELCLFDNCVVFEEDVQKRGLLTLFPEDADACADFSFGKLGKLIDLFYNAVIASFWVLDRTTMKIALSRILLKGAINVGICVYAVHFDLLEIYFFDLLVVIV